MKIKALVSALVLIVAVGSFGLAARPAPPDTEVENDIDDDAITGLAKDQRREAAKAPPNPTPAEAKAREERQAKRDSRVEAQLQKKPKSPQTHYSAAGYFMERGDNARAAALAESGLALARPDGNPRLTSRLLVTRGLLRYAKHDYQGAHEDGELALEHDPKNWAAFELYMYSLEKWPKGKKPLSSTVAKAAGNPAPPSGEGGDISRRGSGAVARGETPTPTAGTPEEQAADRERVARLVALQASGLPRSPEEWVASQKAAPSAAFDLLIQAKNALASGNPASALSLAEAAVLADPADPMVYAQRALILNRMGDTNGAVLDLSRVIAKGWKWSLAFKIRADALFKAGKWKAALADAELAVRLDPSDPDAYFIRAMARSKLGGDPKLILADLDEAARLRPALAPFRDQARARLANDKGPGR